MLIPDAATRQNMNETPPSSPVYLLYNALPTKRPIRRASKAVQRNHWISCAHADLCSTSTSNTAVRIYWTTQDITPSRPNRMSSNQSTSSSPPPLLLSSFKSTSDSFRLASSTPLSPSTFALPSPIGTGSPLPSSSPPEAFSVAARAEGLSEPSSLTSSLR